MGTQGLPSDFLDDDPELATSGLRRSERIKDRKKQDPSAVGKAGADLSKPVIKFLRQRDLSTDAFIRHWYDHCAAMDEARTPRGKAWPYRMDHKASIEQMFTKMRIKDIEMVRVWVNKTNLKWKEWHEQQAFGGTSAPTTPELDAAILSTIKEADAEVTKGRRKNPSSAGSRSSGAPTTPQARAKSRSPSLGQRGRPKAAPKAAVAKLTTAPSFRPGAPGAAGTQAALAKTKAAPKPKARSTAVARQVEGLAPSKKRKNDMPPATERATTRSRTASAAAAAAKDTELPGGGAIVQTSPPGTPLVSSPGSPAEAPFIEFVGAPVGKGAKVPTSIFPFRGSEGPPVTRSRSRTF